MKDKQIQGDILIVDYGGSAREDVKTDVLSLLILPSFYFFTLTITYPAIFASNFIFF